MIRRVWHRLFGHPARWEGDYTAGCRSCGAMWDTDPVR